MFTIFSNSFADALWNSINFKPVTLVKEVKDSTCAPACHLFMLVSLSLDFVFLIN